MKVFSIVFSLGEVAITIWALIVAKNARKEIEMPKTEIPMTIKQNVCMFAHIHLEKYSSTEAFTGNQDGQGVARMNSKALFMVIIFVGFSTSSSP